MIFIENLDPVRRQFPCRVINQFVISNPRKVPWFSDWGADRNIIKLSCQSRLFLVVHLLVNSVVIMVITRYKGRRACFHSNTIFFLLKKTRVIVQHLWVSVNWPMGAFEWIIWPSIINLVPNASFLYKGKAKKSYIFCSGDEVVL